MVLFQGGDDYFWFWMGLLMTAAGAVATWFYVITGRDRKPTKQRRGEETIERYGTIEEDRAPLSRFLFWTYIGVALWALAYALWTGFNGIAAS